MVGDTSDDVLKCGDLEFVEVKEVPKSVVLMRLCMEVFQPWRAFAGLFGVEMLEDAMGRWVEGVVGKEGGELGVPKFKIREVRCALELKV